MTDKTVDPQVAMRELIDFSQKFAAGIPALQAASGVEVGCSEKEAVFRDDKVTRNNVRAAAYEELLHYQFLTANGAKPATTKIWIPDGLFASEKHLLGGLVAGDQVIFTTDRGVATYEVRGVIIVPESHIGIAAQSNAHTATLFACHPKGSATHRIVAKLRLLNPDGTPADPDEALPPIEQGTDPATDTTLVVRDTSAETLPAAEG